MSNSTNQDAAAFSQYELDLYRASNIGGVYTVRMDEQLTLLYGNDLYFKVHDYAPEALLGKSCAMFIHPQDLSQVHAVLDRARTAHVKTAEWEMRIITGQGVVKHTLVSGSFNTRNGEEVFDAYITDISKQKKAEQALRASEEKFRIATENSDLSFWTYFFASREIVQSSAAPSRQGFKTIVKNAPESLVDGSYIRGDSAAAFLEMYRRLEQGAQTASGDFWTYSAERGQWWCEHIDYTNVFDEDGRPLCAHAVGRDVTAAKIAERKYREEVAYANATQSDGLLVKVRCNVTQNLVESYIAKGDLGISKDGMLYALGVEALAKTGSTPEEQDMIRRRLNRENVLSAFSQGDTTASMDYRRKLPDGRVLWVNTSVKSYQNPETGDVMSFMYTNDINDAKIKDSILNMISATDYDYIAYVDLKCDTFKMYLSGEEFQHLLQAEQEPYSVAIPKVNREIVVPQDVERSISEMMPEGIRANLKNQRTFSTVYGVYDQNRQIRQKRIRFTYLDEANGQVLLTRTDITDLLVQQTRQQDMLETALLAAKQANSAKSNFLSRMSHEIRTPMNAIIGMSAIAAQSIGDDDQIADCISKIGISSRFLLSLINDILDMSRIESGKMLLKNEKIPFEEFLNGVNSICYSQAQAKGIDYENLVDSSLDAYYMGDAMKLQQVMINILSNAIKFTPEGGRVALQVRQMKRVKNHAVLRFSINDTGCGISEEFFPHLFEPFAQEHAGTTSVYGGTGLGLSICKHLVSMMDGHIEVRSIAGVGSEFTVDVKLGITPESKAKHLKKQQYSFAALNTLVVDDDVTVCEHAVRMLKEIGVKSEWVDSGRKAVERVQSRWDSQDTYDLVLVDWKMPEMDGIETARQIRKIVGPDVTIIIMTAYDWASIEHDAKLAGVNLLMSKPMFKSSLLSAFETIFGGKQSEQISEPQDDFRFEGRRVLLAEDHPLNVEVAKKLLERKGFSVDLAETGLRAMELFTASPVGYYHAILMDIRMPEMDGLQATYNIRHWRREDAKTVPIIAMTANAFEDDMEKSKAAGMNAHLAKPIDPHQLFQTLYEFIECKGAEQ